MLDLDVGHFDTPWIGLSVQDGLQVLVDFLARRQQFVQFSIVRGHKRFKVKVIVQGSRQSHSVAT